MRSNTTESTSFSWEIKGNPPFLWINHGKSWQILCKQAIFIAIFHSSVRVLEASPSKQADISHPGIHNVGTKGKKKQLASHIGKSSNADFPTNGLMTVPVCESKRRYRVSRMRVSAREDTPAKHELRTQVKMSIRMLSFLKHASYIQSSNMLSPHISVRVCSLPHFRMHC